LPQWQFPTAGAFGNLPRGKWHKNFKNQPLHEAVERQTPHVAGRKILKKKMLRPQEIPSKRTGFFICDRSFPLGLFSLTRNQKKHLYFSLLFVLFPSLLDDCGSQDTAGCKLIGL
jgi:hypothetical protein